MTAAVTASCPEAAGVKSTSRMSTGGSAQPVSFTPDSQCPEETSQFNVKYPDTQAEEESQGQFSDNQFKVPDSQVAESQAVEESQFPPEDSLWTKGLCMPDSQDLEGMDSQDREDLSLGRCRAARCSTAAEDVCPFDFKHQSAD